MGFEPGSGSRGGGGIRPGSGSRAGGGIRPRPGSRAGSGVRPGSGSRAALGAGRGVIVGHDGSFVVTNRTAVRGPPPGPASGRPHGPTLRAVTARARSRTAGQGVIKASGVIGPKPSRDLL